VSRLMAGLLICSAIAICYYPGRRLDWTRHGSAGLPVGEGFGGLSNATFGNAKELLSPEIALQSGTRRIVENGSFLPMITTCRRKSKL
jgi:hypothetical protein